MSVLSFRRLMLWVFWLACLLVLGVPLSQATVITDGCANADQSCSLDELVRGGRIIIDDKRFDEWFADDLSSSPVDLASIEVLPLDDQPLSPGLQFNANGALATVGRNLIDVLLSFTVSTLDGSVRIKDNSLEINDFTFGPNNAGGFIDLFEDVLDPNQNLVGEKFVTADNLPPPVFELFDSAQFPPQAQIRVDTLIFVGGDAAGDTVSLERFTQRFSQIPEPSALILLGIGLTGLGLSRRRAVRK